MIEFNGWKVPAAFVSDGCTFVPDSWFGKDLTNACALHDFLRVYDLCPIEQADREFHSFLLFLGAPKLLARVYWIGVKLLRPFREDIKPLPTIWEKYRFQTKINRK